MGRVGGGALPAAPPGAVRVRPADTPPPAMDAADRIVSLAHLDAGDTLRDALAAIGVEVGAHVGSVGRRELRRGQIRWHASAREATAWLRGED